MTTDHPAIDATIAAAGLTVSTVFVPFSQSRNKAEKNPSLNYQITIQRNGRDVLTTDYMMGQAHCPAYRLSMKEAGHANSIMRAKMIRAECETGRAAIAGRIARQGPAILPNPRDVIYSIIRDADAIDFRDFAEWANEYAYCEDSRKAEAIYRACLSHALALRSALGDDHMRALREAFTEY